MVINVFVHQLAPFMAGHPAEEGVSFLARRSWPPLAEAMNQAEKPCPLRREISFAGDHECRIGWRVFSERLPPQNRRPYEWRQDLSKEPLLHRPIAGCGFQGLGAMAEHLGRVHLAPLSCGYWLERGDAGEKSFT